MAGAGIARRGLARRSKAGVRMGCSDAAERSMHGKMRNAFVRNPSPPEYQKAAGTKYANFPAMPGGISRAGY